MKGKLITTLKELFYKTNDDNIKVYYTDIFKIFLNKNNIEQHFDYNYIKISEEYHQVHFDSGWGMLFSTDHEFFPITFNFFMDKTIKQIIYEIKERKYFYVL